jgi:hypothetical protein
MKQYDKNEVSNLVDEELAKAKIKVNDSGRDEIIDELLHYQQEGRPVSDQLDYIINEAIPNGSRVEYFKGVEVTPEDELDSEMAEYLDEYDDIYLVEKTREVRLEDYSGETQVHKLYGSYAASKEMTWIGDFDAESIKYLKANYSIKDEKAYLNFQAEAKIENLSEYLDYASKKYGQIYIDYDHHHDYNEWADTPRAPTATFYVMSPDGKAETLTEENLDWGKVEEFVRQAEETYGIKDFQRHFADDRDALLARKKYSTGDYEFFVHSTLEDSHLYVNSYGKNDLIDELAYQYKESGIEPQDQMEYVINQAIPNGSRDEYFKGVQIKDDEAISLAAVQAYEYQFNNVSDRLKNDPAFLAKVLEVKFDAIDHFPDELIHEFGDNDPIKYLKAKANMQKIELTQNQQVEKKTEVAPKIKI